MVVLQFQDPASVRLIISQSSGALTAAGNFNVAGCLTNNGTFKESNRQ